MLQLKKKIYAGPNKLQLFYLGAYATALDWDYASAKLPKQASNEKDIL
jgi:hypothetical protein